MCWATRHVIIGWRFIQYLYFHPASQKMQSNPSVVVVLGTGGTIAGKAADSSDNVGYTAAQLGAQQLVAAIPALADVPIEVQQIAQIDSKDMSFAIWRALAEAVDREVQRSDVCGVVITHGTDTLEETAYFLQRVLAPQKPVVIVGAMRPATALQSDGPQNIVDAVCVARTPLAQGVVVVLAGKVHSALNVRKVHPYRLDAFGSGDSGIVAHIEEGRLRQHRDWPSGEPLGLAYLPSAVPDASSKFLPDFSSDGSSNDLSHWPWVEIITSNAGSNSASVEALRAAGVQGIVVAGTGNGSVHRALETALMQAQAAGVAVLRCTRCLDGSIVEPEPEPAASQTPPDTMLPHSAHLPSAGALTPVQARIELMLRLLKRPTA
jgi:L-asparaginase